MDQPAPRISPSLPVGAIVAGIGGLVALIGTFLDWARLTSSLGGDRSAGQAFEAVSRNVPGISHWTGLVALVASVMAVAGVAGAVFLNDPTSRRMAAMGAGAAGAVVVLAAALGAFLSESIVVGGIEGGREALDFQRQFIEALGIRGFQLDTGPAAGVFVTAVGGIAAATGAFMAAGRGGRVPVVPQAPAAAGRGSAWGAWPPGEPAGPPEPPAPPTRDQGGSAPTA